MAANKLESTLTDRYQTTVPETVRRALRLGKRDRIAYKIEADGAVIITRAVASEAIDPVMDSFLGFLAEDMLAHPERIKSLESGLMDRLKGLVGDVDVDLDAPLSKNDE